MEFTAYLNFPGTCAEAFRFYEKTFGGKISTMQTFGETPMKDHVPPDQHGRVMHAHLAVGSAALMGSDGVGQQATPEGMSVAIGVQGYAEGERIFNALADGGSVTMPYQQTFWSKGFGMVTDRFGVPWMVNVA